MNKMRNRGYYNGYVELYGEPSKEAIYYSDEQDALAILASGSKDWSYYLDYIKGEGISHAMEDSAKKADWYEFWDNRNDKDITDIPEWLKDYSDRLLKDLNFRKVALNEVL